MSHIDMLTDTIHFPLYTQKFTRIGISVAIGTANRFIYPIAHTAISAGFAFFVMGHHSQEAQKHNEENEENTKIFHDNFFIYVFTPNWKLVG